MIGGTLNIKHVRAHWDEILRLATSIKQGTVTASLMLRKLGSYPTTRTVPSWFMRAFTSEPMLGTGSVPDQIKTPFAERSVVYSGSVS